MAIALHLRRQLEWRLELSELVGYLGTLAPHHFPTASQLASAPISSGRWHGSLGDLFEITANGDDEVVEIHGDLALADGLGGGCLPGRWIVLSDVGHRWGAGLSGGRLDIHGDAGDDLGNSMSGGVITLSGNAGVRAGGPRPGAITGMSGGTIIVGGNCSAYAGWRLRRGNIAIVGDAGHDAAWQMLGGTMLIGASWLPELAAGARRGTVIVANRDCHSLLGEFRKVCHFEPTYLRIQLRLFADIAPAAATWLRTETADLYRDPTGRHGKCEVFVLHPPQ